MVDTAMKRAKQQRPAKKSVRTMCYIPAHSVDRLEIAGGYLWAKFDRHLYRVPLTATR